MRITTIICTWNRAALLAETLSYLERVEVPADVEWEVIVVDNGSTDNTAAVVAGFESRLPLRRVVEPRLGLSAARNRGIDEASGDLVLWTDDDVRMSPGWLRSYADAVGAHPEATWFGGPVEPWFGREPPSWIARNIALLNEPYALVDHGPVSGPLTAQVVGANFAVRTAALRAFRFNEAIGPRGSAALTGDETEFLGRLKADGHTGWWIGDARVRHYIKPDRLTYRFVSRWYRGLGVGIALKEDPFRGARVLGYPRWAIGKYLWLRARVAAGTLRRDAAWMQNLREAGILRGYLSEVRARKE